MVSPEDKRAAVAHVRQAHRASERRACGLVGQPRSTQRYGARPKPEDTLPKRIAELAAERPRFGYRRLTALLKREGISVWHGRVHRITKELRLQVPRRKRKRFTCSKPVPTEITRPNQRWGMDFVSDSLADGRSFRALAIVDQYTRECPVIEVDLSLPGARVLRVLEQLADERGCPMPFVSTTGLNLFVMRYADGASRKKWNSTTSNPASPCRMGTSNRSTANCAMSV